MKEFPALLQTFLIDYLPRRRGFSPHTVASYRDAFVLLLKWMSTHNNMAPDKVTMASLDPDRIDQFTRWLREDRQCAVSTTNARVAAIKSFAKCLASGIVSHLSGLIRQHRWGLADLKVRRVDVCYEQGCRTGCGGSAAAGEEVLGAVGEVRDLVAAGSW